MRIQFRAFARILALVLLTVGMVAISPTAQAQTFKVIHSFTGSPDGGNPYSGLTLDTSGSLYGATAYGGSSGCDSGPGCGTVFQLAHASGEWSESMLYAFSGGADGNSPGGRLIFDAAGNLYGTAESGGIDSCGDYGCGVIFELTSGSSGWTETVVYGFPGGTKGGLPIGGVIFDKGGNLYGTLQTFQVYELTNSEATSWQEKVLHNFGSGEPEAAPILDAAGNLYGTTSCCGSGGTVWELLHGTWKEKTVYSFASGGGANPWGSLIFDKAGNLYGTTELGGKYDKGVVFKLAPGAKGKWKETVLHTFKGGSDGEYPYSTPVLDGAGNLYAATYYGGDPNCNPPNGCGTVVKLTPGKSGHWKETVLHRFSGGSDGGEPYSESLVLDAAGNLYGTATYGGNPGCFDNFGCGVVFEITP